MNKNYLGHLFLEIDGVDFSYKCEKCKILIWNSSIGNDDYWLLGDDLYHIRNKLKLTCDEYIIKNIIE